MALSRSELRVYQRSLRHERVKAGLCGWCGAERENYRWLCDRCATIHREKQRAKAAEHALLGITRSYTAFIAGKRDRRNAPVSESMSDQIKSALDLSTWDEQRGFGSIKGPICPHCATLQNRNAHRTQFLGPVGKADMAICEACGKEYHWRHGPGPMGWQWDTWIEVPKAV